MKLGDESAENSSPCFCWITQRLTLHTKPKIRLQRIRFRSGVKETSGSVDDAGELAAASPGSDLIGWLSGAVMSAGHLIACVSGRMRSAAGCWWTDSLPFSFCYQLISSLLLTTVGQQRGIILNFISCIFSRWIQDDPRTCLLVCVAAWMFSCLNRSVIWSFAAD